MTEAFDDLDAAQLADAERLVQAERNFRRTPTWRKVDRFLLERQTMLIGELSARGMSDGDRAMLQGMLSLVHEMRLQLPGALVQETHPSSDGMADGPEPIPGPRASAPDLL